jgi:hypothetical protein
MLMFSPPFFFDLQYLDGARARAVACAENIFRRVTIIYFPGNLWHPVNV